MRREEERRGNASMNQTGCFISDQNTLPDLQHNRRRYAEMLLHLQQSQPEQSFD